MLRVVSKEGVAPKNWLIALMTSMLPETRNPEKMTLGDLDDKSIIADKERTAPDESSMAPTLAGSNACWPPPVIVNLAVIASWLRNGTKLKTMLLKTTTLGGTMVHCMFTSPTPK